MDTKKPLLSFYSDMLFVNSIESIKESFIGNSTLKKQGYFYIQEYNYYMKDEIVEDNGIMPVFVTDIITKEDFLEKLINFENKEIYKNLEAEISQIPEVKEKLIYTKNICSEIEPFLKRALRLKGNDADLIRIKLLEIINFIKDRYSNFIEYHKVFKYLTKEKDNTFFKEKDLKYSFYIDLYEMAYSLDLIDDSEIEEIDFINAFTSPNPHLLESKIRFSQNNYITAYFLDSLKPFFNELNHAKIEQSEVFLNKQNKHLKSNDIYTSLSRGKNKIEAEKAKIDKYILKLKSDHLK